MTTTTWRARDSRGHYLASKDVHTTLGPEDWDDTCRHTPAAVEASSTGETFGHDPVEGPPDYRGRKTVCARCQTRTPMVYGGEFDDPPNRVTETDPVPWPCTSAIVLGLEPRPAVSSAP